VIRLRGLPLSTLATVIARSLSRLPNASQASILFCIADHYEPMWGGAPLSLQRERVERWQKHYPEIVAGLADSRGRPPQHTFFYPIEEYDERLVEMTAEICRAGYGSLEFHLHHDGDSPQQFRDRLELAKRQFDENHSALTRNASGQLTYGFVHGNWALCNALPNGRWCGVNDELTILRETGCYADFTMPAAPDPAQTRTVNSIYYAQSRAARPRSHDYGVPAAVGRPAPADHLLLIQGPLMMNWQRRKWGVVPKLENGDLHGGFLPASDRLDLWIRASVGVMGRPDWIFIKLHTHGAPEKNAAMLLGDSMRRFHQQLISTIRERRANLYYVNAREMADAVHAAERGDAAPLP
jgi:hypothetical protein